MKGDRQFHIRLELYGTCHNEFLIHLLNKLHWQRFCIMLDIFTI